MTRDEDDSTQQAPTLEDRFFAVAIDLLLHAPESDNPVSPSGPDPAIASSLVITWG